MTNVITKSGTERATASVALLSKIIWILDREGQIPAILACQYLQSRDQVPLRRFDSFIGINALGYYAAYQNTGSYVSALGREAGMGNSGSYCFFAGQDTGEDNDKDYVIAIGRNIGGTNLMATSCYLDGNLRLRDCNGNGGGTLLVFVNGAMLEALASNVVSFAGATITNADFSAFAGDNVTWSNNQFNATGGGGASYTDADATNAVATSWPNLDTDSTDDLTLSGGTLTDALNMGTNRITNVADPVDDGDAISKQALLAMLGNITPFGDIGMGIYTNTP